MGRLTVSLQSHFVGMLFLLAAFAAAVAPLVAHNGTRYVALSSTFPGWPSKYEGLPLTPLPMSAREARFAQDFPGRIGRFSDGAREIILRWVAEPTRNLHPASDCFRGIGYRIAPLPLKRDASGKVMSCFRAGREGASLTVCEGVTGATGRSWPDVSSWYWSALFGPPSGPWWSVVVAQGD